MKATTTEEKNKVLAEFMGESIIMQKSSVGNFLIPMRFDNVHHRGYTACKYHSSYDWLMPVWHKFRDLETKGMEKMIHCDYVEKLESAILWHPITEAFDLLVEAVEWYNSINDKKE